MLLGVDGVCVISHGSSSARAIVSAVRVAHDVRRRPALVDAVAWPRRRRPSGPRPGRRSIGPTGTGLVRQGLSPVPVALADVG